LTDGAPHVHAGLRSFLPREEILQDSPATHSAPPAPHAAAVPPIRATSHRYFGLVWLLTLACAVILYFPVAFLWIKFYRSPDIAFSELLYRQKAVLVARRANEPKRIFAVGGSGVLFGIDCELIEKKLGIPSINYGVYAGLGLGYMLDRVQRDLRSGDIVILSPEYSCWGRNAEHSLDPAFQYIWTYDQRYFFEQPPTRMVKMIGEARLADWSEAGRCWMTFFQGKQWHFDEIVRYNVATIGQNGDVHVNLPVRPIPKQLGYPFPDPNLPAVDTLKRFARDARAKGVQLIFTWPAFARPDSPQAASVPPDWLSNLLRDVGFTVLDAPADNTFPPLWFQDTEYHVTAACRRVRTEELIRRLRPVLGLPPAPDATTAVLLVGPRNHRLNPGNIFADQPGLRVRVLSDAVDPRAITPAQITELVRAGTAVYIDADDETNINLAATGLATQTVASERVNINKWYIASRNLFALAATPGSRTNRLPVEASGATVAVVATREFAAANRVVSDPREANLDAKMTSLVKGEAVMPAEIRLRSSAGGASINVDAGPFCSSADGVCAAAIDPQLGTVVDTISLPASATEVEKWRVDRITLSP
jgi:hypothetical protein